MSISIPVAEGICSGILYPPFLSESIPDSLSNGLNISQGIRINERVSNHCASRKRGVLEAAKNDYETTAHDNCAIKIILTIFFLSPSPIHELIIFGGPIRYLRDEKSAVGNKC